MKVKINDKWYEGRYDDKENFIIPLYGEVYIKFFYKWEKQYKSGESKVNHIEYKKICESGILRGCYPILSPNEDEVILKFDSYETKEVHE